MNEQTSRRPGINWLLLVAAGVVAGFLVGGSVSMGLCALVYLVHR